MSAEELKPCPFCGSTNIELVLSFSSWFVRCNECDATGPMADDIATRDDEARAGWNLPVRLTDDPMCPESPSLLRAIKVTQLWQGGKMIGEDEGHIASTLLEEVMRLHHLLKLVENSGLPSLPHGYEQGHLPADYSGNIWIEGQIRAYGLACCVKRPKSKTTDELVNRFLAWKLPKDFSPDAGISFDGRGPDERGYDKGWPTGTNLLSAEQAREMIEYVLGGEGE